MSDAPSSFDRFNTKLKVSPVEVVTAMDSGLIPLADAIDAVSTVRVGA